MKRLILSLLIVLGTVSITLAQNSVDQSLFSNAASGVKLTDTITNTGVVTMTSSVVKGAPTQTTVTATFTKLTGTVAGTATLQGSINGTDWAAASATSYTVTDVATQTTAWQLTGKNFLYYRVNTVGSGTSTYTVKGQVLTVIPKSY